MRRSCLPYTLVGLHVLNCELFAGRSCFEGKQDLVLPLPTLWSAATQTLPPTDYPKHR